MFNLNALTATGQGRSPWIALPRCRPPTAATPGPERRSAASQGSRWLALMLDEIDYGMLLLADGGQVMHVNHAARAELNNKHPLQLQGRELRARLART